MAGQPQIGGWLEFDATDLRAVESAPPHSQQNIIDEGESFDLELTFEGVPGGPGWENMKSDAEQYEVRFYAEGIGVAAGDIDFGPPVVGNLNNADDQYTASQTVTINQAGVYKIAGVVTFPTETGVLGFRDDLLLQVHPSEN